MPASYTHQCIARAAFQKTQCCIDPHPAAILAGAEGPDPLFFTLLYFGRGTSPSSMGHLLHEERSADFLTALLKGAGQDRLLLSYALGFLTHYAGDTIFHPYIFTRSYDNGRYSGNKHCKYEHILDTVLYRKSGHALGLPRQMAGFKRLSSEEKDAIASLLTETIAQVFPEKDLRYRAVRRSFDHAVFLCDFLRKAPLKKRSLFLKFFLKTPAAKLADSHVMPKDTLANILRPEGYETSLYHWESIDNAAHTPWFSCWEKDRERTESTGDLYRLAVARAGELIDAGADFAKGALSEEDLRGILGDYSYNSGLSWQETDMKLLDLVGKEC